MSDSGPENDGADGQTPREKYFSYVDKLHESDHEQWERNLALLQEIEKDNQEGYDKLVISISSGAVGVSFLALSFMTKGGQPIRATNITESHLP